MFTRQGHRYELIWCENCGAEIICGGYIAHGHFYCCRDCYLGRPCECGQRMEIEDERRGAQMADAVYGG